LSAGTNISIVEDVVSCDLVGSTNIDITGGVISTTGLQEELSAGTNISIVDNVVSCDLVGSTNIDITSGVISTTGLQDELSAGTNVSIVDDVISCDLVGSTNVEITDGVISTTGIQEELSAGTNISIVDNVVSCDLAGSTNIDITGGVISTTGFQDEITKDTDLSCNSLNTNQLIVNDNFYFDTIVIRRPTKLGTGQFTGIREVQLFVNNVNVLPNIVTQSTFIVDGTPLQDISNIPFFIDWSDTTLDTNHATFYLSNVVNDIIDSTTSFIDGAYWGITNGAQTDNINVGLYITMSKK